MSKKTLIIGAFIAFAVIGSFVIMGSLNLRSKKFVMAKVLPLSSTSIPNNERIDSLKMELEKVVKYELSHGCVELDKFGNPEFCAVSKVRVETLHDELVSELARIGSRELGVKDIIFSKIRDFSGNPSLKVFFDGVSSNPYSNSGVKVEFYHDEYGFEYWIDSRGNNIVQFGPGPNSFIHFADKGSLSLDELREKAEGFLLKQIRDFMYVKENFILRETIKPNNTAYAFRWESKDTLVEENIVPFVQVVLSPAGEIMSFNDVRSLYVKN